jgi:hypothetical protein
MTSPVDPGWCEPCQRGACGYCAEPTCTHRCFGGASRAENSGAALPPAEADEEAP